MIIESPSVIDPPSIAPRAHGSTVAGRCKMKAGVPQKEKQTGWRIKKTVADQAVDAWLASHVQTAWVTGSASSTAVDEAYQA